MFTFPTLSHPLGSLLNCLCGRLDHIYRDHKQTPNKVPSLGVFTTLQMAKYTGCLDNRPMSKPQTHNLHLKAAHKPGRTKAGSSISGLPSSLIHLCLSCYDRSKRLL